MVECKLASNSERRRMVVGQVIDYAAAIWHDGIERFLDGWTRAGGTALDVTLEPTSFDHLRRNIAEVRINLCLAVDRIDSDLRRLVEYLNLATRDEITVTALQLSYARDGDVEILIPSIFGAEIASSKKRPASSGTTWTWESFISEIHGDNDRSAAERLYKFLHGLGETRGAQDLLWFGARPNGGVFFRPFGLRYAPFQLWINTAGKLMLYGNWSQYQAIKGHAGFAELAQLLGQDHKGGQRSVPVSTLDVDRLWSVAVRCAAEINSHPGATNHLSASVGLVDAESRGAGRAEFSPAILSAGRLS